ncbi:hypothetical protein [Hydrocarboniphaga effusa]|uniref:hypothetical protein n=1 Tax=Hydrocarboniphaga effusa TaxID=243629 RepID=UPI003BAA6582
MKSETVPETAELPNLTTVGRHLGIAGTEHVEEYEHRFELGTSDSFNRRMVNKNASLPSPMVKVPPLESCLSEHACRKTLSAST